MLRALAYCLLAMACSACAAAQPIEDKTVDLTVDGVPWLRTVITPWDQEHDDQTYKVYTHILDFAGTTPITKGPGGKYTHHRGLFIGWKDTLVDGRDYDTWHMSNSYERCEEVVKNVPGAQELRIGWYTKGRDKTILEERRVITAKPGENGARVIDFESTLVAPAETQLKGDLQHAGMHVRMAQEVADHEAATEYLLPEGAVTKENDEVDGAWWVRGSFDVGGKRYDLIHMTPKNHPLGQPVYSIRPYGRFGSFNETTLKAGEPLTLRYRIVVSDQRLDASACQAQFDAYAAE